MMTYLRNQHCADIATPKILEYLLNLNHQKGCTKAKYFFARGFTLEHWETFKDALLEHVKLNGISETKKDKYAVRFVVDCHFPTPDKTNPCIRTVWQIIHGEQCPRLITAHPKK